MSVLFSGSEIVQMAIQMERSGAAYYECLAKSARDAKAREVFACLAGEEQQHEKDFQRLLTAVGDYRSPETYPGEYDAYAKALVESRVFTEVDTCVARAQSVASDAEAVDLAIVAEKDAILFLQEMRRFVPPAEHGAIENLLEQEREHLRRLVELRETVCAA
ncbi:MAG TPA: hypothetical protein EYP85_03835 [Armatimonadetes bacterium]|nr:hypothetical protein [Armatimonadota bacterium]